MKLKEVLDKTVQFFKDKKIETPRLDAEILFSEALGFKSRVDIYLKFDQPLKDEELTLCREYVKRRGQGEPVAYILGKKDFFGHEFKVGTGVLIPRPETELLVEKAIEWIKQNDIQNPKILDLGCGTGCIGFSIAKAIPGAQVVSVEKSPEAFRFAKTNAESLEISNQVEIIHQDVFEAKFTPQSFDVVVANPPYIAKEDLEVEANVKKFEPETALFSEKNGYQALETWSEHARAWLKPTGFMGFEMGYQQGSHMAEHFKKLDFSSVEVVKDLAGLDRHIIGVHHG